MTQTTPLVTVGVPTYNRPCGLRRTLDCISNQTYQNLEIIISDNASSESMVEKVVQEYKKDDDRIIYIKHEKNEGAIFNFRFLLKQAKGSFFMWAADDDEWDSEFISKCMYSIGNANSVMSSFSIHFRDKNRYDVQTVPELKSSSSPFENCINYLRGCKSSLFYGIHKTDSIGHFLTDEYWDFYDCYFVLNQILNGGFITIPDVLYTAGIDTEEYALKPIHPQQGKMFIYGPFLIACLRIIFRSKKLYLFEKLKLTGKLTKTTIGFYVQYEAKFRPVKTKLLFYLSKLL